MSIIIMKIHIESMNLIVLLHNLHLYNKKKISKFGYLFSTPKKYLIDLDFNEFKNFIDACLHSKYNDTVDTLIVTEGEIIQLIESYDFISNAKFKIEIIKKIGNYILTKPKIKRFKYLHKLVKYYNYDIGTEQNIYIKFLIILINNFISLQEIKLNNINSDNINILDFIFDYYIE
jgi:hypothetical protein